MSPAPCPLSVVVLIVRLSTVATGTAALTVRVSLSVTAAAVVIVCMPVVMPMPMPVAMPLAVTVSMSVTLAHVRLRQLPDTSFLEGFKARGDIRLPGEIDPEPRTLKAGEGATAEPTAQDGVRRAAQQGVERPAGTVLMACGRVSYGFPLPGLQVEEGEEGGSPEVG